MYGAFLAFLCVACFQDIRWGKISNVLTLATILSGGLYAFSVDGWQGVLGWLVRTAVYLGVLYPLFKIGTLGAGDVKLMAAVEGVFSWNDSVLYFACVWFVAGAMALVKMLMEGNFMERMAYFFSYITDVAVMGKWQLYHKENAFQKEKSIYMSIPLLIGFLLCMGD